MTGINLTPNFDQLYITFKRECLIQSSNLFTDMPTADCNGMAEKRDALRAVHALLAPINVALQCATTVDAIQDMRDWLANIVTDIEVRADSLDADLEPDSRISLREWCDQCEALGINGVPCHETGCPNEKKTRIDGEWVRFFECLICGGDVREGESCDCDSQDWNPEDEPEEEDK